ncbi:MAG: hypothetical protein J7L32_05280 [Thermoplasmata archaeon]|nr:hypothetical protein [Thermoplasmata archaeon]
MVLRYTSTHIELYPESPEDIPELMKELEKAVREGLKNDMVKITVFKQWMEKEDKKHETQTR